MFASPASGVVGDVGSAGNGAALRREVHDAFDVGVLRRSDGASADRDVLGECESHRHRYHRVDTRILRIFNTYGPRMQINDGRVIPNFMWQALRGENLTVYGDGSQTRSFCYVGDEVDGILRLARSAEH